MLFEEYVDLIAYETGFPEMNEEIRLGARKGLMFTNSSREPRFGSELRATTGAIKNAKAASGSFPVVVYAPGFGAQSFENSVLCEYLASHGFIVVASPSMGVKSRAMTFDQAGIEAQARDIEFLISFMHNYPNADPSRLVVMGYSWGGMSNTFGMMRNDNVKAIVCLDGSIRYFPKFFKDSPYHDWPKPPVPLLFLASPVSLEDLDTLKAELAEGFYNSLKYSDAYLFTFNALTHENFCSTGIKLQERDPNSFLFNEGSQGEVSHSYEMLCRYVLNFLNAYLKNDPQAAAFLKNLPEQNGIASRTVVKQYKVARKPPPTLFEFAAMLKETGFDKVEQTYAGVKKHFPDFTLKEDEVTNWVGEILSLGKIKEASEVAKLNGGLYPNSSGAYSSLAVAYVNNGEKGLAIRAYEKALELSPENAFIIDAIRKLKEQK